MDTHQDYDNVLNSVEEIIAQSGHELPGAGKTKPAPVAPSDSGNESLTWMTVGLIALLLLFSIVAGCYLSKVLGSSALGFLITGGFYLVCLGFVIVFHQAKAIRNTIKTERSNHREIRMAKVKPVSAKASGGESGIRKSEQEN